MGASAPSKLPHPRLQAENREERISSINLAAFISFEQGDGAFAGKEAGGVEPARMGEFAKSLAIHSVQELTKRQTEAGLGSSEDFVRQDALQRATKDVLACRAADLALVREAFGEGDEIRV
jgi:hypothetical protein